MADFLSSNVKNSSDVKLSKSEKKKARKQAKSRHTLLRHEGIHTSKQPTKHLIVGNGGLGNGVSRNDLKPLFSQYGQLTDIVMLPGKPYSVICYTSVQEATMAYEKLQAWQLRPNDGAVMAIILYLSFINEVPRPKMTSGDRSLPPGLILIEDFIEDETEKRMMESIQWEKPDLLQDVAQQTLKHRRVKHFGYEFNYTTNNIDKDTPLSDPTPSLYNDVIDRIMTTGIVMNRPDQITVNEYQPGQGIPPHVDTHSAFQDAIVSLSLGSQVLMEFTNPTTGRHVPVFVPRRSLLIMTGEARYLWSHGITPRKSDIIPAHIEVTNGDASSDDITKDDNGLTLMNRGVRMSFTFRAVRGAPCHCGYPSRCDTQLSTATSVPRPCDPSLPSLPTSDLQAMHLEAAHVHKVYESIAGHFSETRHKPWPQVTEFMKGLPVGSVLLDVGCGNGKYLDGNPSLFSIGCDRSVKLVEICNERRFQAFTCDGLNLSVRNSSIDACICIAVIHHFSTENRRLAAIEEIARVLRPGGLGLIYVWAKEQERQEKKSHYISSLSHKNKKGSDRMSKHEDRTAGLEHNETPAEECLDLKDNKDHVAGDVTSRSHSIPQPEQVDSMRETSTCTIKSKDTDRSMNFGVTCVSETCNPVSSVTGSLTSQDVNTITDDKGQMSSEHVTTPRSNAAIDETQELKCDGGNSSTKTVLSVHTNRTEFESQDMLVPWHLKKKTGKKNSTPPQENGPPGEEDTPVYHRFYHVFQEGELEGLCKMVSGVTIKSSHYDQGNWGVIIMKL